MRVLVKIKFIDKHTGEVRKVGDSFICNKERYAEIIAAGPYVEEVKKAEKPVE